MSLMTSPTRLVPSHQPWNPHPYQARAVEFLLRQSAAALFLDPGLGKTSIVLEAFRLLKEAGQTKRMLVVAPLRVIQTVWRQEGQKWSQFRDLTFALLHGSKKAEALQTEHDIALVNPEGVEWLVAHTGGMVGAKYDVVTLDELTKFKNSRAKRHKALRPALRGVRRRWGLTGTPAPNGYLDLFGQFLILDDGAALGRYITHYRTQYFTQHYNGFDWMLQAGGQERIEARLKPYVLRMAAADYLSLPPLVEDIRYVELPGEALKTYKHMKAEMIAELPGGVVTAQNAGGVINKLRQMANGAVYRGDGVARESVKLHDAKLDALEELLEELAGQPLLLAYEYQHDLERLQARFPFMRSVADATTEKKMAALVQDWNRNEIMLLAAHPASAGHGLNMQEGGAQHIAWLCPTWDLELQDQFIKRVLRQGNTAPRVVNHIFIAKGTDDERVLRVVKEKGTTQDGLLARLGAAISEDQESLIATEEGNKENPMSERLGTQSGAPIQPKGWGAPAAVAAQAGAGSQQRQEISAKLQGQAVPSAPPSEIDILRAKLAEMERSQQAATAPAAQTMFSQDIVAKMNGAAHQGEAAPQGFAAPMQRMENGMAVMGNGTTATQPAPAEAPVTTRKRRSSDTPVGAVEIDYSRLAVALVDEIVARFLPK